MDGLGHGLPADDIREALQRVLQSGEFEASERNRQFLRYVVEGTLAGRAERIKAYSVATEVFGRGDDFDPQADPIVRIEASRLRRALERYYFTAGGDDPIRITIPKGSYVPAFASTEAGRAPSSEDAGESRPGGDAPAALDFAAPAGGGSPFRRHRASLIAASAVFALLIVSAPTVWFGILRPAADPASGSADFRHGPAIFVAHFAEEGDMAAFPDFGKGFTREVILGLTRFKDLFVFGPETSFSYGAEVDPRRVASDLGVNFILTGAASISGQRFTIDALLMDARSGQYLWAEQFSGALGTRDILAARNDVAGRIARTLAQPYGVIFTNQAEDSEGKPPGDLSSYECVIRFYLYWKTYRREEFPEVLACLERAIAVDPAYADAFAALSLVHSDSYRFGFGEGAIAADPRQTALELAHRAIELAPDSARGHHALSLALWLMNDVDGSLEAGRAGLALNPNDTELMAELGMRYAWRNNWENALPLLRRAFARNPGQPSGYRLALFLDHYLNGRYEAALAEAQRVEAPDILYGHVAVAMAAVELGRKDDANAALDRLLVIVPAFGEHVVADLERRNIHPDLILAIVGGLRKAGLAVPDGPGREKS